MRTYSHADWTASLQAWADGDFSDEWKPYRHQAAMRGMIFPPEGTRWDSWEDDNPSQRAILIRAIRETPTLMTQAIARSRSWGEVIAYIVKRRDEWRADLIALAREAAERKADEPTGREATMALKRIIDRLADS